MRHELPSKKSKWYLPKETFLTVVHYCLQYPIWLEELKALEDTRKALVYDRDRVQASTDYDSTAETAMRRAAISAKKDMVEQTAQAVGADLSQWLLRGVGYDRPYYALRQEGMPCGRKLYYQLRRRFYYEMAKRI